MKLLLDTNILIDYYAQRAPFANDATRLRIAAFFGDVDLWASSQSFADVEYILSGAIPREELRQMMAHSLDFMNVCAVSADDVKASFRSGWPDLEDYLIACAALRIKADFVITRDKKGFVKSEVPALSPADLFALLEQKHGVVYEDADF
jgi:predicted nucleic acid-binding protein